MEFGATHKKKNTYIVKVNNLMADTSAFGMCQNTPLPVIVQNGQRVQNGTGAWMRGTNFPNPAAASMQAEFDVLKPVMGEKLASMIIEYLDKDTGRPVLTLFPTSVYVHDGYEKADSGAAPSGAYRCCGRKPQCRIEAQHGDAE